MPHKHEYYWYPAINEKGWRCIGCDEGSIYSPKLDRELIWAKVDSLLRDLHDKEFICISNGTEGDMLGAEVADRCVKEERYDQYSIILFIMEVITPDHAEYWKNKAKENL
jgi:hypothetical protein